MSGGDESCATATPIAGDGSVLGDNVGATTDGPSNCGALGSDVWYDWTAPGNGTVTISMCNPGTGYDTVLTAYDTAACTGAMLACNDDTCPGFLSQISFGVTNGSVYKIQVGGFSGATGTYEMSIATTIVVDECEVYDIGVTSNSLGFGSASGTDVLWMHRQGTAAGSTFVSSISTAWGSPLFGGGNAPPDGTAARVGIWDDPNDDGNPNDLVLLQEINTTVTNGNTDRFQTELIALQLTSGIYFIGASTSGPSPAPMDETSSSAGRAWVCGDNAGTVTYANLNGEPLPPAEMDSIGFPAVFLLEADCKPAQGTALKVFVYNGGNQNQGRPGDQFNSAAQGWVFEQMGLLGAQGEPPTLSGDDLLDPQGQPVGRVIRDGALNIIGVRTLDGTMRAYNVDTSATIRDAWNAVSDTGELVIAKHGVDGGGAMALDAGKFYSGFRPAGTAGNGTGVLTIDGPYDLPGRPGETISVYLNGCFTSLDPDGNGPKLSVTDTAGSIPGVFYPATGHVPVVYKWPEIIVSGPTDQEIIRARDALAACAKRAGFMERIKPGVFGGDWLRWVSSLPFHIQLSTARDCIVGTGASISISYSKSENESDCPGNGGCYYAPVTIIDGSGGQIHYQASPDHPSIDLWVPPGSLIRPNPVFVHPTILDTPLPSGTELATYVTRVRDYGLDPLLQFNVSATMVLSYPQGMQILGFFEVLSDGTVVQEPAQIGSGQITTQLDHDGVYIVLAPSPASIPICFGDGSNGPCPCGNSGTAGHGCENSSSTGGAILTATGTASLAADTLVLTASDERPTVLTIILQGDAETGPLLFGDGLRCVGGTMKRLYAKVSSGGVVTAPVGSELSVSARSAALGDMIPAGATRYYQSWYRDQSPTFCPDPPGKNWNASSGLAIAWEY